MVSVLFKLSACPSENSSQETCPFEFPSKPNSFDPPFIIYRDIRWIYILHVSQQRHQKENDSGFPKSVCVHKRLSDR